MKKIYYDFSLPKPMMGVEIQKVIYNLRIGRFFSEAREFSAKGTGYYCGMRCDFGEEIMGHRLKLPFIFCVSDGFDSPLFQDSLYSDLRVFVARGDTAEQVFTEFLNVEPLHIFEHCKELALSFFNSI